MTHILNIKVLFFVFNYFIFFVLFIHLNECSVEEVNLKKKLLGFPNYRNIIFSKKREKIPVKNGIYKQS
jgi:hypothetical protein